MLASAARLEFGSRAQFAGVFVEADEHRSAEQECIMMHGPEDLLATMQSDPSLQRGTKLYVSMARAALATQLNAHSQI